MKIAIPSSTPDLSGKVEQKLGTAAYLLIIETDDMSFEAVEGPTASSGPGAGVKAISLILERGAQTLLVGFIAPHMQSVLHSHGIEVYDRRTGVVALMLAWVSVGVIQLPAEGAALGWCFAVVRNLAGFCMAIVMAVSLAFVLEVLL
ncbi:MAG: hypothetical protein GY702_19155 [Desulfobulbaceae bacterium]|nr:hypothetical protein [Desulfobulbaceae bacterium]